MKDWKPYEHIERACVLTERLDQRWNKDGEHGPGGGYVMTPPALTLAQVHLQIAHMKMIGGQRA
jgi:hypothetical protein